MCRSSVAQLDMWLITVSNNLVNAGGREDRAEIPWVKAAKTKTYDELANSGEARFKTLDAKLKVALMATIKADCPILHSKLQTLEREAFNKDQMLNGRQVIYKIYDHFRINANRKGLITLDEITALKWQGDHKIHDFMRAWLHYSAELEIKFNDDQLRDMLFDKLKASKKLEPDIAYFQRLEEGNPQKTLHFLLHCIERLQEREQEDKNRRDRKAVTDKFNNSDGTALAAEGKGKGKGGKGKKRTTSRGPGDATGAAGGGNEASTGGDDTAGAANRAVDAKGVRFCYFHNNGGCHRQGCTFSHETPPKHIKTAMTKPVARSASPPPAGRGPHPKAKAKAKGQARAALAVAEVPPTAGGAQRVEKKFGGIKTLWCQAFINGKCKHSDQDCPLPHISAEAKEILKAKIAKNIAEGKHRQ